MSDKSITVIYYGMSDCTVYNVCPRIYKPKEQIIQSVYGR